MAEQQAPMGTAGTFISLAVLPRPKQVNLRTSLVARCLQFSALQDDSALPGVRRAGVRRLTQGSTGCRRGSDLSLLRASLVLRREPVQLVVDEILEFADPDEQAEVVDGIVIEAIGHCFQGRVKKYERPGSISRISASHNLQLPLAVDPETCGPLRIKRGIDGNPMGHSTSHRGGTTCA